MFFFRKTKKTYVFECNHCKKLNYVKKPDTKSVFKFVANDYEVGYSEKQKQLEDKSLEDKLNDLLEPSPPSPPSPPRY
jgi:hypothetical protein